MQTVGCGFRLKSRDDKLCGLCEDETGQILAKCLNCYKTTIAVMCHSPVGPLPNYATYTALEQCIDAFISRAKGDDFTVDFRRYVGIGKPDKHCNFQVEVLKKLDTQSQLQFNVPYLIYSPHICAYLAADTPISVADVFFGYLFYTERARASRVMFREVGDIEHTGIINNNTEVQLTLCNDAGGPSGVVKRSKADPRALVLDKDGNVDFFGEKYSPRLEYIT